ncbi:hypothetical protein B7989_08905 [Fibrobacter sp. UWB5]|nr:hypothetical protein B7989_08905 [Fibrobacter sp. UWB5]
MPKGHIVLFQIGRIFGFEFNPRQTGRITRMNTRFKDSIIQNVTRPGIFDHAGKRADCPQGHKKGNKYFGLHNPKIANNESPDYGLLANF